MFAVVSSYLGWNLIVIATSWLAAIIIAQIIKYALFKISALKQDVASEIVDNGSGESSYRVAISRRVAIFNIAVTAAALIMMVIFIIFMNNSQADSSSDRATIHSAALPADFKPMTPKEIDQVNKEAVTAKSEAVQREASQANKKAMDEAVKLFRQAR